MNLTEKDQEKIDKWELKRNLSETTLQTYLLGLKEYCKLLKKSPAELIDEAITEERQGIFKIDRTIEKRLLKYKKHLKNTKAESTQKLYMSIIKSFYKAHDVELPQIEQPTGDLGLEENYGKLITKEELKKMVSIAAPRERALIYLMSLSGMSQAEARNLTIRKYMETAGEAIGTYIETLEELFKHEKEITEHILQLNITRGKVKYRYITFVPPETSKQIFNYLRERINGRNLKVRPRSIDEPLFVKNYGEAMSQDDVGTNIKRVGYAAGFKKKKGAYAFWRPHGSRKYFISTIINELDNPLAADFMAGHKIPEMRRRYWYVKTEKLRKIYEKALPFLSIDNVETVTIDSPEVKELKEINKVNEERINNLEQFKDDILNHPELLEVAKRIWNK